MPAVTFDNQTTITGSAVTTLTTNAFTITSNPNRAAIVGCSASGGSAFNYTVGGVADNGAIPGCSTFNKLTASVTAPPSGSQTATVSWTGAADVVFGVATFYNVKQATPTNNGTNAAIVGSTGSVTVTSTAGDLTVDHIFASSRTFSAPTQNSIYNTVINTTNGASSYGPGTGTTTHQWTASGPGSSGTSDGVNLVQADDLMPQAML